MPVAGEAMHALGALTSSLYRARAPRRPLLCMPQLMISPLAINAMPWQGPVVKSSTVPGNWLHLVSRQGARRRCLLLAKLCMRWGL